MDQEKTGGVIGDPHGVRSKQDDMEMGPRRQSSQGELGGGRTHVYAGLGGLGLKTTEWGRFPGLGLKTRDGVGAQLGRLPDWAIR